MNDKIYSIQEIRKIATPIADKYGVKKLFLFGSYATGTATKSSDIDFRIDKGKATNLFLLGGLHSDLEDAFRKKIDLLTTESLDDEFLNNISSNEILIYEYKTEKALKNSVASIEMEGMYIDEQCKEWCRQYMYGEITMEKYIEQVKKQVGIDT